MHFAAMVTQNDAQKSLSTPEIATTISDQKPTTSSTNDAHLALKQKKDDVQGPLPSELLLEFGALVPHHESLKPSREILEVSCAEMKARLRQMDQIKLPTSDMRAAGEAMKSARTLLRDLPAELKKHRAEANRAMAARREQLSILQQSLALVPEIKRAHMQNVAKQTDALLIKKQKRARTIEKLKLKLAGLAEQEQSKLGDSERSSQERALELQNASEAYKSWIYRELTLLHDPPKNPASFKDGIWSHIAWTMGEPIEDASESESGAKLINPGTANSSVEPTTIPANFQKPSEPS